MQDDGGGERVWVPSITLGRDQGGVSSPPPRPAVRAVWGTIKPFSKKNLILMMMMMMMMDVMDDAGSPPRGPAATTVRKQSQQN